MSITEFCVSFGKKMNIMIVESPTKAKTINKYLDSDYTIVASFGHVRDLLAKNGSVSPDDDFSMKWNISRTSRDRLSEIAHLVKESDSLILATDPDREGEAISWHVLDVLRQQEILKGKTVKRVVFNAITQKAVLDAMQNPRDIDGNLVDAYLARRALDYLVGFTLSPVLWHKLPGARSAGRVQSVALRLVCARETEIERFVHENYWSLVADLRTLHGDVFTAKLLSFENEKFGKLGIKTLEDAKKIYAMLAGASFQVQNVESKLTQRNPPPPFTTSTLQQLASSQLSFSASRTMQLAQRLYEGVDLLGGETTGLITYMRTDGVQMTQEAVDDARTVIINTFGYDYLPDKPRLYSTKAKNAQEAHEAIRPTNFSYTPDNVRCFLDTDQAFLYEMIWKRAISSQMRSANVEWTTVDIKAEKSGMVAGLRATGSVILFDGFIANYLHEDVTRENEKKASLPIIRANEDLTHDKITVSEHTTEPPPRYSEATLIRKLEELGIGRPSTYESILAILQDRGYVIIEKRKLIPQVKGRIVTAFLEFFFNHYIQYGFTADLEEKLDLISDGQLRWKDVLHDFWLDFSSAVEKIKKLSIANVLDILNDVLAPVIFLSQKDSDDDPRLCPLCSGQLSLKIGHYGAFVGCSEYPKCKYTRQLKDSFKGKGATERRRADKSVTLGQDPETGKDVTLRSGRFGHYVQHGNGKSTRRVSLPKDWNPAEIDLHKASLLLSLPREIGIHPETGKIITANIGRYGSYLAHDGQYAHLKNVDEVFIINISRAVITLAAKQQESGKHPVQTMILGKHPKGGNVSLQNGRYGPYIKWGKINVMLPKDMNFTSITLKEALTLIGKKLLRKRL